MLVFTIASKKCLRCGRYWPTNREKNVKIAVLFLSILAGAAHAAESRSQINFHLTQVDEGKNTGVAGWFNVVGLGVDAPAIVFTFGPRLEGLGSEGLNMELQPGGILAGGESYMLGDLVLEMNPELWNIPMGAFAIIEVADVPGIGGNFYTYLEINYTGLPHGMMLGAETENNCPMKDGPCDFTVGPHLILTGNLGALMLSWQAHVGRAETEDNT
ncbi:MAG: hypothetical protein HOE53_04150, partial [Candidatus Magasanikbacteria bacterium]|nr:hypothetical protein [Candidatus Magasanikbacteria bacterium]